MVSTCTSFLLSILGVDSIRASTLPRCHARLVALCLVLAAMVCGGWSVAPAQTAHFSGAQSVIANAATNGLHWPDGVAVDGSGNVYIADTFNNRVLKETSSGGNFGTANVGSTSATPISMIFTFDTAGTLGSTAVVTQGAKGLDFANAGTGTCKASTAYTTGETCTVDVSFTPKLPGARYGAAELLNSSGKVLATGYVQGTGVGPLVNFMPGTPGQTHLKIDRTIEGTLKQGE